MSLEIVGFIPSIVGSKAVWEVLWAVSLSIAALSFIGLGGLIGRGALLTRERQRPHLSTVAGLLFWVGLGSSVLGLVAAVLSQ